MAAESLESAVLQGLLVKPIRLLETGSRATTAGPLPARAEVSYLLGEDLMMKRRTFVVAGATFMTTGTISLSTGVAGTVSAACARQRVGLSKQRFVSCLGSRVEVAPANGGPIEMYLARVDDGPTSPATQQFSVVLEGPRWVGLKEGLYRVSHPELGDIALYLEPGPASAGISRLRGHFSLLT